MSPHGLLHEGTARAIIEVIKRLGDRASFRSVMVELRKRGGPMWHRTLRRYLDLLVQGGVLEKRSVEVRSVYPMELYRIKSTSPRIHVGLTVLRLHGLNWDVDLSDIREVESDLSALVRARPTYLASRLMLAGCVEDCIAYEFKGDVHQERGAVELLAALLATKRMDLAYLFERGDRIGVGGSLRMLFRKVLETFMSSTTEADARTFLAVRQVFLSLVRQYSSSGTIRLAWERGRGLEGISLVKGLSEVAVVNAAGKQLGVVG